MKTKLITTTTAGLLAATIALTAAGTASAAPKVVDFPSIPGAKVVADYRTPHDGQLHLEGTYSAYTPEQAKADLDAARAETPTPTPTPTPAPAPTWKQYVKAHKGQATKTCVKLLKDRKRFGFKVGKRALRKCVVAELRRGFNQVASGSSSKALSGVALAQFCFDEISWRKGYELAVVAKDPRYMDSKGFWTEAGFAAEDRLAAFDVSTAKCPWGEFQFVPFATRAPYRVLSDVTRRAFVSVADAGFVVPQGVPNGAGDWVSANASPGVRAEWLRTNFPQASADGAQVLLSGIGQGAQLRRSTHPDVAIMVFVDRDAFGNPEVQFTFFNVVNGMNQQNEHEPSMLSAIWTYEGEIPQTGWFGGPPPTKAMFGYMLDVDGTPLPWDSTEFLLMY